MFNVLELKKITKEKIFHPRPLDNYRLPIPTPSPPASTPQLTTPLGRPEEEPAQRADRRSRLWSQKSRCAADICCGSYCSLQGSPPSTTFVTCMRSEHASYELVAVRAEQAIRIDIHQQCACIATGSFTCKSHSAAHVPQPTTCSLTPAARSVGGLCCAARTGFRRSTSLTTHGRTCRSREQNGSKQKQATGEQDRKKRDDSKG